MAKTNQSQNLILWEDFEGWVLDHKTICEDFKNHFGFKFEQLIKSMNDIRQVPYDEIDVAKDPDWKDINGDKTINDDFEWYEFADTKFGNCCTWYALDQVGKMDTFMILDDSDASLQLSKLVDSRLQKDVKPVSNWISSEKPAKKAINWIEFIDWFSDHETLVEDFKKHFGFEFCDILSHLKDTMSIFYQVVDIAKDPAWKEANKDLSLNDEYDLDGFISEKYGNNYTWHTLDAAGKYDTIRLVDDSDTSILEVKLTDSRTKKKTKNK